MRGGVDTSQFAHNIADEDFGIAEEHERFVFIIQRIGDAGFMSSISMR